MEKFEIVVIGAGPAGLRAAEILAGAGKKVIVLEKNQMIGQKICAGGIFPKVFYLGIPKTLTERTFNSIKFHTPWQKREIKSKEILLATISREKMGKFMAKEAERAGAKIFSDSEAKFIEKDRVILKNNQSIFFDYLIGADGGLSLVRRYLNLPSKYALTFQYTLPENFEHSEIFYEPKLFGSGYAWIFPHGNCTKVGCGNENKF